jgi:hypothetical protein
MGYVFGDGPGCDGEGKAWMEEAQGTNVWDPSGGEMESLGRQGRGEGAQSGNTGHVLYM